MLSWDRHKSSTRYFDRFGILFLQLPSSDTWASSTSIHGSIVLVQVLSTAAGNCLQKLIHHRYRNDAQCFDELLGYSFAVIPGFGDAIKIEKLEQCLDPVEAGERVETCSL